MRNWTRKSKRVLILALFGLALGATAVPAQATTIDLGDISYDTLIPDMPGSPGVTNFTINNFTGDPSTGGFALPPDFPVFSNVTLQNSTLVLTTPSSSLSFNLGDFGPGSFIPTSLEFSSTMLFTSATFTASLNSTSLLLFDGTTFNASSAVVTATILPSSGTTLIPGTDFALLQVSNTASTPEPATYGLCASAFLLLLFLNGLPPQNATPAPK